METRPHPAESVSTSAGDGVFGGKDSGVRTYLLIERDGRRVQRSSSFVIIDQPETGHRVISYSPLNPAGFIISAHDVAMTAYTRRSVPGRR